MAVFVILTLATVTFDGISETSAWLNVQNALHPAISPLPVDTFGTIDTLGLLFIPLLFLTVYLGFSWVLRLFEGTTDSPPCSTLPRSSSCRWSPSHWHTTWPTSSRFYLFRGRGSSRSFPTPSASTGTSSATASYLIDINIITPGFVWWVSIIAIVLGHILSVYIAHIISLRRMPTSALAVRSQYPMLALMIVYTATSLWIIAQPIAN